MMHLKRNPIESESMRIIDDLAGNPDMDLEEKEIRSRVVHTSGDPSLYRMTVISGNAIDAGVGALKNKHNIITDVRMVEAGIRKKWLTENGNDVYCAIDLDQTAQMAKKDSITRSAAAINILKGRMDGAIVLIGNAPTALLELLGLVRGKKVKPSLIIGVPVGFVDADRSKDLLAEQQEVPYITLPGTRGGSNIASAILNALINIYMMRK